MKGSVDEPQVRHLFDEERPQLTVQGGTLRVCKTLSATTLTMIKIVLKGTISFATRSK
jgi:hypothetical protein